MAGRKLRDAADARACLAAAEASGLRRCMWATTNGIDGRSLHAWHLNLTRGKFGAERPVSLVEYVPAGSVEVASPSAARYRVWCGPFAVEVDGAFDANVLRRLLSVVAAC